MGKIVKLPDSVANKIAAGEVVERPASVVKELVENSIDAGATFIQIIIKNAGKELIQIIDNGEGMTEEDALLSFERHATSKIKSADDLGKVMTLGFRGEALPSIASVSLVELKTRQDEMETGVHVLMEGGILKKKEHVAMNRGTHLSIKNIFFNTPARRNFMRSDTAELQRILIVVKRFLLGYPHIAFKVMVNDKIIFDLPVHSIDQRLKHIFGDTIYRGMVHFMEERDNIVLEGYVARPDFARNARGMEYIFLNGRPIENRSLNFAIVQAFGNLLERRQYPPFVAYITIPPDQVDVNVHPTKLEVKFRKEQFMFHLFSSGVKKALNRESIIPSYSFRKDTFRQENHPGDIVHHPAKDRFVQGKLDLSASLAPDSNDFTMDHVDAIRKHVSIQSRGDAPASSAYSASYPNTNPEAIVPMFQMHNRYILAETEAGLMIIDQHVAHERILFEKILNGFTKNKTLSSQQLLFPQTIELDLEDYLVYSDIKELLLKIGFSTSELSGRTIVIEAIPTDVKSGKETKVLLEILDEYRSNRDGYTNSQERMAAAFACKNAIKSGDRMSREEMEALLSELFRTDEPYFCPHGRPVIITLPLEELDRKFKRIK